MDISRYMSETSEKFNFINHAKNLRENFTKDLKKLRESVKTSVITLKSASKYSSANIDQKSKLFFTKEIKVLKKSYQKKRNFAKDILQAQKLAKYLAKTFKS